jgi:hypothetical protein
MLPMRQPSGGHRHHPACELQPMTDERAIRLLEEIRDLQRQHMERYGEALRNQQEAIRLQQAGLRRVRVIMGFAGAALVLAVGMLVLLIVRVLARMP